jgi:hypothetical protein
LAAGLAAVVFLINVAANAVLFLPGESPYRDSIEGGYASMARFIASNPDPWGWNPLQYCGIPTRFWYLPVVPYFTALWIHALPFLDAEHVFRLVVVTLACLGPVTVYLFAYYCTRSAWWAMGPALALTFFSPGYYYFKALDWDRGLVQAPWRIQTLIKYGEGPHHAALALLPLTLIALWRAATGRKYPELFVASLLMAVTALTNWVGALALAWCVLMMLVTAAGTVVDTGFLARRVFAAAGLAYLMACFWLTPTFIRTTAFNWPADAFGYKLESLQVFLLGGLAAGVVLLRLLFFRMPGRHYLCFLFLCFWGFAYVACCHYWFGKDTIPEARRYLLEAELFLFLLLFELFRLAMRSHIVLRGAAVGLAAFLLAEGASQFRQYALNGWSRLRPFPREESVEYQTARRLYELRPGGRIFASGGTRFRLNSWFDLPQTGGTFESGLRNRAAVHMQYQAVKGNGSEAVQMLRLMGAEYAVVHFPGSREHYRDVQPPEKFEGLLEPVQGGTDRIYRALFPGYANLVWAEEMPEKLPTGENVRMAERYVAAMDDGRRPRLEARWLGCNRMVIRGAAPEGMLITVRVAYDEGWRALQDGQAITIEKDAMEFLLLRPRPSENSTIELRYGATLESKLAAGVSGISWALALVPLLKRRMRGAGKFDNTVV